MNEDAERIAKRWLEVWQTFTPLGVPRESWEEVDARYRQQLITTFDEMLRAELIFGGPSLYADPAV